jgi:hypothetical protein
MLTITGISTLGGDKALKPLQGSSYCNFLPHPWSDSLPVSPAATIYNKIKTVLQDTNYVLHFMDCLVVHLW